MKRSTMAATAAAAVAVGGLGLGAFAIPAGAGSQPSLPDIPAEELVASVMETESPPALHGTVTVENALGLPAMPGLEEATGMPLLQPESTAQVWADGEGRSRLSVPSEGGEQTVIDDGQTLWRYDSTERTATALDYSGAAAEHEAPGGATDPATSPAEAAQQLLAAVEPTSTVSVDGTAEVAGRPAYDLVVTPAPGERTVLREIRVAVDSEERLPLRVSVLAAGSPDPALEIGFSELSVGQQDAGLFTFEPPQGVTVERHEVPGHAQGGAGQDGAGQDGAGQDGAGQDGAGQDGAGQRGDMPEITTVGDGWDTVALTQLPAVGPTGSPAPQEGSREGAPDGTDPMAAIEEMGEPISGAWGEGSIIRTAVGNVLISSDGRVAAGAVPEPVLIEALTQ